MSEAKKLDAAAIRASVEGATAPVPAPARAEEQQIIAELAGLDPISFARQKKEVAKQLGVPGKAIEEAVKQARKQHQAEQPAAKKAPHWAPAPQLWPEKVAGAELVAELVGAIHRFVMLDDDAALIVALWILFTWTFEHVAETNPFLRLISATPGCGKSTLFKVISRLARTGWIVARISQSAFIRTMDIERRTLLLDEADSFLNENELMRNVLDGASDPDTATVSLSVKNGDEWIPAEFNVFVPIAIASIGPLRKMQTVEDRSIAIHLKRATPEELKQLAKGRRRELKAALEPVAQKCARWVADNLEALKNARPELPEAMSGREQDKWEPLILMADAIGGRWPALACAAAVAASGFPSDYADTLGVMLLADLKKMFDERKADRMGSKQICDLLIAIEGRPWAEYRKGKPLSQNQLARLLKPFGISPGSLQFDDDSNLKGYLRSQFADVFASYFPEILPVAPTFDDSKRQSVKPIGGVREGDDFQSVKAHPVDGAKSGTKPNAESESDALTVQKRDMDDGTYISDGDGEVEL